MGIIRNLRYRFNKMKGDSDYEYEIPPDPAHEERMRVLREENELLTRIVMEQDEVLQEMGLGM